MKIYVSPRIYLIIFISSIIQAHVAGFCISAFLMKLWDDEILDDFIVSTEVVAVISFIAVWIGFICVIQLLRRRIPPSRRNAAGIGAIIGVISQIGYAILTKSDSWGIFLFLWVGAMVGVPFGIFNYWFWQKIGLI